MTVCTLFYQYNQRKNYGGCINLIGAGLESWENTKQVKFLGFDEN